jgi:hypothetical protein
MRGCSAMIFVSTGIAMAMEVSTLTGGHGERLRVSSVNDWALFDSDTVLRASGQSYMDDCTSAMMEAEAVAAAYFDPGPALPLVLTAAGAGATTSTPASQAVMNADRDENART